jgi:hypothetical protein
MGKNTVAAAVSSHGFFAFDTGSCGVRKLRVRHSRGAERIAVSIQGACVLSSFAGTVYSILVRPISTVIRCPVSGVGGRRRRRTATLSPAHCTRGCTILYCSNSGRCRVVLVVGM